MVNLSKTLIFDLCYKLDGLPRTYKDLLSTNMNDLRGSCPRQIEGDPFNIDQ